MIGCDDVDLILAVGAAGGGAMEVDDARVVREHLPGCTRCTRAAAAYTATADLLVLAVEPVQPGDGLRARIMSQVYASVPAATPALGKAQRERAGAGGRARGLLRRLWRALPSSRGLTVGGAVAAAAAVALLVWSVGPWHGGGTGGAPLTASVKGTLVEPGVQGSLTYYPQTETAVLSVRGLTPQADRVYEVWLVRPSNAVTAAGYLTRQPDGTWSVAMHGSMAGYSAVAATLEPPGGSATPTGQQVLVGSLPTSG